MFRVGQGFDVHAFVQGRPLIVGGVTIPYEWGLQGHSDADVLLHAVTDAFLGALGMGDIGRHFPDTDDRYQGADSASLLRQVGRWAEETGFDVGNIDATLIAQQPKMAPYIGQMQGVLADTLGCPKERVNIKATTTEWLGFAGRGEGIAAMAVALLQKRPG